MTERVEAEDFSVVIDEARADPVRAARIDAVRDASLQIHELAELRRGRGRTQVDLAKDLDVSQANISRLETATASGADMLLSTLTEYVEALGGTVEIRAVFDDAEYVLRRLHASADEAADAVTQKAR